VGILSVFVGSTGGARPCSTLRPAGLGLHLHSPRMRVFFDGCMAITAFIRVRYDTLLVNSPDEATAQEGGEYAQLVRWVTGPR